MNLDIYLEHTMDYFIMSKFTKNAAQLKYRFACFVCVRVYYLYICFKQKRANGAFPDMSVFLVIVIVLLIPSVVYLLLPL